MSTTIKPREKAGISSRRNTDNKLLFSEPEDRALADISDFQGVGGKQGRGHADRQIREATIP